MFGERRLHVVQVCDDGLAESEARRHALVDRARSARVRSLPAMPKRPGPSASSTSSDVAPDSASSKSWITPAPFIASAQM